MTVKSDGDGSGAYVVLFASRFDEEEASIDSSEFTSICTLRIFGAWNGVDGYYTVSIGTAEDRAGCAVA